MDRTMLAMLTRAVIDGLILMDSLVDSSQKPAYLLRPFPFLEGADEVILEVCMSSPMYLQGVSIQYRVRATVKTHDCKNLLPPSSFSCSLLTSSTRSTIACRLV